MTISFPVPPVYEIVAGRPLPMKFAMVAPCGNPPNVPLIASAPSLTTMVNTSPGCGTCVPLKAKDALLS